MVDNDGVREYLLPRHEAGRSLLAMPYAQRQRIIVVDDAALDEAVARAEEASSQPPPNARRRVIRRLSKVRMPWQDGHISIDAMGEATLAAVATLRKDGVRMLVISRQQAEELDLPVGHPLDKLVYIGDPADPAVYYPAADFHRKTFENKFSEAISLLMGLGATELEVRATMGWGSKFAAELDVPLPRGVSAEMPNAKKAQRSDSSLLFYAHLTPNEPRIPEGLVWFPRESAWQQVAAGRMEHGLDEFKLDVRYSDDYGINAGFAASIKKVGLGVGGEFTKAEVTQWRIEGRFGQHSEPA
jgi:hypothetical protein